MRAAAAQTQAAHRGHLPDLAAVAQIEIRWGTRQEGLATAAAQNPAPLGAYLEPRIVGLDHYRPLLRLGLIRQQFQDRPLPPIFFGRAGRGVRQNARRPKNWFMSLIVNFHDWLLSGR
jgi:hypothetical protein